MSRQNHFSGGTLAEAVRNATTDYGPRGRQCEVKNQRRCNDLLIEINQLKQQAGRYSDEAGRLKSEADSLKRESAEALAFAVVAALSTLGVALLRLQRLLRLIERFRKGYILRSDIIELLSLVPAVSSAVSGLLAVAKFAEAQELARDAEELNGRAERMGEQLLQVVDEYSRLGCGEDRDFAGS